MDMTISATTNLGVPCRPLKSSAPGYRPVCLYGRAGPVDIGRINKNVFQIKVIMTIVLTTQCICQVLSRGHDRSTNELSQSISQQGIPIRSKFILGFIQNTLIKNVKTNWKVIQIN